MDFSKPYDKKDYVSFFQNDFLPEDFEYYEEELDLEFSPHYINKVKILGEVPSLELKILEISHLSEHDPRVSITRESFRLMEHYTYKKVLAIFKSERSDNYRLSLLTYDYELEGKKVKKIISPPKRFSFLLGPGAKLHTPQKYLIQKGRIKDFEDLKNRFSIEVVNKEFYDEIALRFTELVGGTRKVRNRIEKFSPLLKLPSTTDHNILKEFGVRLIGRIIFVWFLKRKTSDSGIPLIPENILSKQAIEKNKNYYHSVLEKLFFEILNTPVVNRKRELRNEEFDKIPFLNGGLFDPHEKDFYSPFNINNLKIPDEWFLEFFDILERYNFTIDENTSIDIELSVDPEMLGRIFENLLAEINPQTEKSAKKATGSYYTPREIVDYMVDESIKHYLLDKTEINEDLINNILSYNQDAPKLTENERIKIVDAIENLKILDPACGSGAFPMGIMQKIVLILQKVDPDSSLWLKKQIDKIPDPLLRREVEEELKEANLDYIRKLGIIRHTIYGIDIQQIAVEISKLRAFLSLIVDSKVEDNKDNRGLKPLPNLEFKFVCANTLVKLPKSYDPEDKKFLGEISELIEKYFIEYQKKEEIKKLIKERINNKVKTKTESLLKQINSFDKDDSGLSEEGKNHLKNKVKKEYEPKFFEIDLWNSYQNIFNDKPVKFFEIKYFFPEVKDGFDIVIGNPPYGSDIEEEEKEWIKKTFSYGTEKDSASLFVERGFDFLKPKGTLIYIITFAITFNKNFSKTRFLLFKNFKKSEIYTFDRDVCRIFKSMTQSVSILKAFGRKEQKEKSEGIFTSKFYRETPNINDIPVQRADYFLFPKDSRYSDPHRLPKIGNKMNLIILKKLLKNKSNIFDKMLSEFGETVWYRSSGNFWYNAFDRKPYRSSEIKEIKIRKVYKDLFLLLLNSSLFYLWMRIYGDGRHLNKDLMKLFPIDERIENTLIRYKYLLELVRKKFFKELFMVFDEKQNMFNSRLIKHEIDILDLILGRFFFNLTIEEIYYIINYDSIIRGGVKLSEPFLRAFDTIIAKKERGEDTSKEEFQIDLIVYKLYNLTYDEIKIIDPEIENKITREEWERGTNIE